MIYNNDVLLSPLWWLSLHPFSMLVDVSSIHPLLNPNALQYPLLWKNRKLQKRLEISGKTHTLRKIKNAFTLGLSHGWKTKNNSLFIRHKGESENRGNKKTKHAKFSAKWTFLIPWHAHVDEFQPSQPS